MTEAQLAYRRPPGPEQPVTLGIDQETLRTLEELQSEFGDMVSVTKPNGRLAYFVNDAREVRRILVRRHSRYRKGPGFERVLGEYFSFLEIKLHLGLLLPRFRMHLLDADESGLELGINLCSATDIHLRPEVR